MRYRIKENVDGKMVWDYLESLMNDIQWVVTNEKSDHLYIAYRCGSIQHAVFEWMRENLREQVCEEEE